MCLDTPPPRGASDSNITTTAIMDAVKAAVEGVKDLAISKDNTEAPSAGASNVAAQPASREQKENKPQKQQQPKGEKKEKKAKKGADSGDGRPLELSPPAPFIDHRIQIL